MGRLLDISDNFEIDYIFEINLQYILARGEKYSNKFDIFRSLIRYLR